MSLPLDLHGVADAMGVHYDTARKSWRAWVRELGFPQPFNHDPRACKAKPHLRWRPEAVEAWKMGREAALGRGRGAPPVAANDAGHPLDRRTALRAAAGRAELRLLMGAR